MIFITLTGEATAANRTNVMFIQPEHLEVKPEFDDHERKVDATTIARTIEECADDNNRLRGFQACRRKDLPI